MLASVHPAFDCYAALRASAMQTRITQLTLPRPPANDRPISDKRTHAMAALLLRYNFVYGDFIRHLGGPYTNSHRNWDDVFLALESVINKSPPPGYPVVDFDRAFRLATEGAPLQGHFTTTFSN